MLTVQFPAILELSSLNGLNGFKIDGENANDWSGYSVSSAGDVNGDGIGDLLIGAPDALIFSGRSYVVFGQRNNWNSTVILSNLNGNNGFKISGGAGEQSGSAVSAAGDVNGDGIDDLLIGADVASPLGLSFAGRSYVIFGKSNGWASTIFLSNLNGNNGFKLDGENVNDFSGDQVSFAGDLNGDGIGDILIGASRANSLAGRSYVVFGKATNWSSPNALSSLNGSNGFKLDGEKPGDYSGYSLNAAGDVNDDGINDLIIGAHHASYSGLIYVGRTYVVFGKSGIGNNGSFNLTNLDGNNGFKLDGETYADFSGTSVSAAGDVSGDGIADIVIGAPYAAPLARNQAGRSYVVFGKSTNWTSSFQLSTLNGNHGFKINGEAVNDYSGSSVSAAGDINGDGIGDVLIGAYQASPSGRNNAGRSYVVFGKSANWTSFIDLSDLNGFNGFKLDGEAAGDQSGYSVRSAGDINGDGVDDIIIGAYYADPSGRTNAGRTYVIFGDKSPVILLNNQLKINQGQTYLLTSANFNANSTKWGASSLTFQINNLLRGQFESIQNPTVPVNSFTQTQIQNGEIVFIHLGSQQAPTYDVTVTTPGLAITGPHAANVTFNAAPVLNNNQLTIDEGQTLVITSANIYATDVDNDPKELVFQISNLQGGQFQWVNTTTGITQFSQNNITHSVIEFAQDGTEIAPSYEVTVTDGQITTIPQSATISFTVLNDAPVFVNNRLTLNQGQTVTLTSSDLSATDEETPATNLIFTAIDVQNGNFDLANNPGVPVTMFSQQAIMNNELRFASDGSQRTPVYRMLVSDGTSVTGPQAATVTFIASNAVPAFTNNQLTLQEGETIVLSSDDLSAIDLDSDPTQLIFYVSGVQNGQFQWVGSVNSITQFVQQDVTDSIVEFVHDGTNNAPAYSVAVSDGLDTTSFQPAVISFTAVNDPPVLVNNQLRMVQGETVSLTSSDLSATDEETSVGSLLFAVSDIEHGRFASIISIDSPLTLFSQQEIMTDQIRFIQDGSFDAPSYRISVSDDQVTTTPQIATIDFTSNSSALSNGSARDAAIAIGIIGSSLIGFLAAYLYFRNKTNRDFNAALEGGEAFNGVSEFRKRVLTPIAKHIFEQIKLTGFLGHSDPKVLQSYVTAIQAVIEELQTQNVDLDLEKMAPEHRQQLFKEIVKQTRKHTISDVARYSRFFKAEVTPIEIEAKASAIAESVSKALSRIEIEGETSDQTVEMRSAPRVVMS